MKTPTQKPAKLETLTHKLHVQRELVDTLCASGRDAEAIQAHALEMELEQRLDKGRSDPLNAIIRSMGRRFGLQRKPMHVSTY